MNALECDSPKTARGSVCPETPHSQKVICSKTRRYLVYSEQLGLVPQGDRLDTDFEVLGVLGQGHCAVVYKCRSLQDGQLCAVKRFKAKHYGTLNRHTRFLEAQRLAQLSSGSTGLEHYIVRFLGCWEQSGRLHVQTELCENSLEQVLSHSGKQPEYAIWHILEDVAHGLQLLHLHGLVHMDIKPANILLVQGCCKLSDFGLCTQEGEWADEGDRTYLPPELLETAPVCASDIFSLGLVLLRCRLDCELPGDGPAWLALRGGRLPVCSMSVSLREVVERMIRPLPSERPSLEQLVKSAQARTWVWEQTSPCVSQADEQVHSSCVNLCAPTVLELACSSSQPAINLTAIFQHM